MMSWSKQIATDFPDWNELYSGLRSLLTNFWGREQEPSLRWKPFTIEHDDRAAAFLAITFALRKTVLLGPAPRIVTALDMVEQLAEIGRDRLIVRLNAVAFSGWRGAGSRFTIYLANGSRESGSVQFNRGDLGGSLHCGYDVQGYTSARDAPRIHWNYRENDGYADIDLDGYPPITWEHLTDRNSDVRCWYEAYVLKFGNPGFGVSARQIQTGPM
jgi:hypothetical protein